MLIRERGSSAGANANQGVSIDTSSLNGFITSCAKQTAQDAVVYTGLRGGVAFPAEFLTFTGIEIPYYFFEGTESVPSDDTIKETLKYYMDNSLKSCTNGFESFKQQGYSIEEGDINSSVTIAEEEVLFDIKYPVTLIKDSARETKSDFSASAKVMMPKMISAAREYITSQKENPNAFRTGSLMDIASKQSLTFEAIDRGNGSVIISLIDENTQINKNPFIFSFAVKYNWTSTE
ncbi:MAG: hypothetical protein NT001_00545 [Candidatus Woesearchaeota archaeon]|nr:hypothetical protein [Candidatus Woesearchaeota archaeon]